MSQENYTTLKNYLEGQPGAVLLFVLVNARGEEISRQIVTPEQLGITSAKSYTAKFVVDELLSAKMIPSNYTLYLYIGLPSSEASQENLGPQDYYLARCLTDQGVKLRVRGGAQNPSVGVNSNNE